MRSKYIYFLIIICLVQAVITLKLIFFPYPEFFIYPYLTNHGFLPYKQILDQHFPGLLFLPINLNNLGMVSSSIARIWLIAITASTQLFIFLTARLIFTDEKKAVGANLLYLIWCPFLSGWIFWIDSFMPLFFLPAFYFSVRFLKTKANKNLLFTGIFLGFAVLFKQTALPLFLLLGLFIYYQTRKLQPLLFFLLGFLPAIFLMFLYFWSINVLGDFWYWTIIFNLTVYNKFGKIGPTGAELRRVVEVFAPVLLLPFLKPSNIFWLLLVFFAGALAGAFDRFDFVHFQPALPFGILILVFVFAKIWEKSWGKIIVLTYFLIAIIWLITFYKGHLSDQILLFDPQTLEISRQIKQLTKPNEEIFLFGPPPHLYSLSQTLPAGRLFVFQFPWFLKVSEDRFVEALSRSKPNLVVEDKSVEFAGQTISAYAPKLARYINQNYIEKSKIGNVEFLIRK